uniref:Phycocyanin alpha phycocyanobilin lyase n=1 Tax=Timspurckia oligopyrenoides TaxID=708627 RepID=A0A7S0ZD42_9RHOD
MEMFVCGFDFGGVAKRSWIAENSVLRSCSRVPNSTTSLRNNRSKQCHGATFGITMCTEASGGDSVSREDVFAMLNSEDGGDRARGINQARFLPPDQCLEAILTMVKDANPQLRYAAVSQLSVAGKADPERSFEILKDIVATDKEPTVQAAAADVISSLKLPGCYELLDELYGNTNDWMLRFSIISGLGEMGDPRAYELLIDALKNAGEEEPLIKIAALGALGELGDVRALDTIRGFVDDSDSIVADRASFAIGLLEKQSVE